MATVSYIDATCHYSGHPVPAVDGLDLEIDDGEFMVLVGPSGSGKSTALRMLAGLEPVASGEIRLGGEDVSSLSPKHRDIAMVFQNYALYPHMTVADNMGFALKLRKAPKPERAARVQEAARLLELDQYLARKPKALSGGQRQRVAMGRAIVREPSVFLMDEPLSNLDAKLRVETRANIVALQARLGATTIYVTHDQVEAMTMGHRVAVLKDGILQQVDTPRKLYEQPRNMFVAGFIGSPAMSLTTAPLAEGGAHIGTTFVPLRPEVTSACHSAAISSVVLGIRPESFAVAERADLSIQVSLVEVLGADSYVHGDISGHDGKFVVRCDGRLNPQIGESLPLSVKPHEVHAFHPETGHRLG
jgi:multiple sugar transport system ATP-binding protein